VTTILLAGPLANKPWNGGEAWLRANWCLGLRRLGYDVCFVEQIAPENCIDPDGRPTDFSSSINRAYFDEVTAELGLDNAAALISTGTGETAGLALGDLLDRAADAELLINVSGHLTVEDVRRRPRRRAYLDVDPGFTQAWHEAGVAPSVLRDHDRYLTVGTNVGRGGCAIPTGGFDWHPIAPPVCLAEWPAIEAPANPLRFTTVATWRNPLGSVEIDREARGLKHHEFRKVVGLPNRAPSWEFEIALDIDAGDERDLDALRAHGWNLADPLSVARGPRRYRSYIQSSGAEFSVAQGVYVSTRSGWFSDRTACYLASGRPALVQDTGFERAYPTGEGLVTFTDLDEAIEGTRRIEADYEAHRDAGRALAERHFDSDLVLGQLMDELGVRN
jgi:hypothetical protein